MTLVSGTSTINFTGITNYTSFSGGSKFYYNVNFKNTNSSYIYSGVNMFNTLTFDGNGTFLTSNNIGTLTLSSGKSYSISGTQTITNDLIVIGDASHYINITGGTFSKSSGIVCVNYVNLTNNIASGGAVFYAANSVNLGGANGWIFSPCGTYPNTPANPYVSDLLCTGATINQNGTPPAGETWYWQGASCGNVTNLGSGFTYNVTSSGTYYIRAKDNTSGLWSQNCSSVTVSIPETPAAPGVSSPVSYCQSATAVPLTATGTNLLWYTVPTGGTGSSTAPTPSTITPGTTTYYVSQMPDACESSRSAISVIINPYPATAGTINGSGVVCQQQNAVLYTVPSITNATSYIWTLPNGATGSSSTNSISVNYDAAAASGNITVNGHNSCGDGTLSSLYIAVVPAPAAFAGNDTNICLGSSITLTATGGSSYSWNNGVSQGVSFTPATSKTYTVSVSNGYCTAKDSVVVNVVIPPTAPVIYQIGSTLYSTAPSGNQWYDDNGVIPGEINTTYTPTYSGNFYVKTTDIYGCVSGASNVISVLFTLVSEIGNLDNIKIYPNPVNENIFIDFSDYSDMSNTFFELYDLQSKLITKMKIEEKLTKIAISELSKGVYIMKISNNDGIFVGRVIKE